MRRSSKLSLLYIAELIIVLCIWLLLVEINAPMFLLGLSMFLLIPIILTLALIAIALMQGD